MIWQLIDSSSVGGAERHIVLLAESLERRGLHTSIVLYGDHGANPWLEQIAAARLQVRILDNSFSTLLKQMRRSRPTLVHTHGYKCGILGRAAAFLSGVPVVSTFHSGSRGKGRVFLYDWMDEWTSFLGRRIAVSEGIKERLPFSSAHIPNFVPVPDVTPSELLPSRVGFVGRLSEEKGPDIFCEIARRSPPGIEWDMYGDGPLRRELERSFGDRVKFHGIVTDLASSWRSLGLLVMPSRSEGLPLAALEALANGVPILASRAGALPTIVLDSVTGWLFASGSVSEALEGLQKWHDCGAAAQAALRRNCLLHAREQFSEQRFISDVLEIYHSAGFTSLRSAATAPSL